MIKILAIDDDFDFQEILKVKIPSSEFELVLTSTELEFFNKFDEQKFDVFLLDLSIENHPLKGLEILERIRHEKKSEVPVIVLSNTSSNKIISNALELGANDFVNKPVDGKLLVGKINALVIGNQSFAKELEFGTTPDKLPEVTLASKLKLVSISDVGFLVEGCAYVAKGSRVNLRSVRIKEIFGADEIEVYSTGFNSEVSGVYTTTFEIDPDKKEMINLAKLWIVANKN